MKGTKSRYALFLILSLLLMPLLTFSFILPVKGAEQVFFEDNFENYNVGAFPSSGGWELWYNGAGTEQQIIVDNVSVSPTKSLKLLGLDYWAGFAAKRFTSNSSTIGFEVVVRVEENNGQPRDDARVAFTTKVSGYISREYAPVTFQDSGVITSGGQVLQSYVADRWYKIKVIMDRDKEAYSVWVDGELKGKNLAVTTTSGNITDYPSYEIEAFSVSQCYNSVTAYFDDVKVFEVSEVNPRLELVPNKGIETTTPVGSGFAPNSKISVTWNDTPITTTPSPIITDGYGNFTAIISVLDQTAGTYTVKAVDGMGNEATATFTVTPGSPEEPHITTYITVPDDYPTIQEAINHADNGDTIVVKAGTYYEHIVVNNSVSLIGENKETTIIDGNATGTVVSITANSVIVSGFTIQNCGNYPGRILQANSNGNNITHNVILNNGDGKGISLGSSVGNIVSDNEVSNTFYGIILSGSSYNIISNNHVSHTAYGIYIYDFSDNNLIFANNISNCSNMGMFLGPVSASSQVISGNVVSNNTILSSDTGIMLGGRSSNSTLIDNVIKRNSWGIYLQGTNNNTLSGNDIRDSSLGIYMDGQCNYTKFYHNDFINNSRQVNNRAELYSLPIYWDNGYHSGGNYWSDYKGIDYNGDGIGDVPYVIDENNRDNYPLMSPDIVNVSPSHQITIDTVPPNITDVSQAPVSINGTLEEGVRVTTTVTDAASEVERVAMKYSDGNGTWVTVEMTKLEGDVWVGIIPAFPHGTNVTYTITAEDKAGNTVTTEEQPGVPNQYDVLPEFPLWIGLPLFLIAAASTLVVRKRISSPVFTKICNRLHRLLT